jgi:hypothetical protein
VKVSDVHIARPSDPGNRGEVPGQRPFWPLIVSRQFSVLFTVMWTRCGRGPEPVRPPAVYEEMDIDVTYHQDGRVLVESRPRVVESGVGGATVTSPRFLRSLSPRRPRDNWKIDRIDETIFVTRSG